MPADPSSDEEGVEGGEDAAVVDRALGPEQLQSVGVFADDRATDGIAVAAEVLGQ